MRLVKAAHWALEVFRPHQDDINEAKASGVDWRESLEEALKDENTVMVVEGNTVLGIGGNTEGLCWFVIDELMDSVPKELRKEFRAIVANHMMQVRAQCGTLWNYVWNGNEGHKVFLKSLGAEFHDYQKNQKTGETFQLFTIN